MPAPFPHLASAPWGSIGFTRIEALMIVAVTALVAAVGVSALRTYLVRAQVVESIAFAHYAQNQVTQAFRRTGTPPANRTEAGLSNHDSDGAPRYVAETRVTNGRIDLFFGSAADKVLQGRTLSLTPFETVDGEVVWVCGTERRGVGLNPLGFAGGGKLAPPLPTTIEPRYLPPECR
jgi:type IV pilus assembly protein PilA